MAWAPTTYDVISRNHSNWPSLNLSQNVREGWANSYWKHQVLIFYPLGKNSENLKGNGIHPPPLPLYVARVKIIYNHAWGLKKAKWGQVRLSRVLKMTLAYKGWFSLVSTVEFDWCIGDIERSNARAIDTQKETQEKGGGKEGESSLACSLTTRNREVATSP